MSIFENTNYYLVGHCSERTRDRVAVLNSRIVTDREIARVAILPDTVDMNGLHHATESALRLWLRETYFLEITEQVPPKKSPEGSILTEAESIVNGARASDYGSALESFSRIGKATELLLNDLDRELLKQGVINASTACKLLMAVKIVRESHKHKRDNLVDLCGYSELLNRLYEGEA